MTMPRGILFLRAFVRALIRSLFFTIGNLQDSFAKMRVRRAYWFRAFRHRLHPLSSRFKPRRFICVAMILVMAGQSFLIAPQITQAAVDAISTMAINYAQDAARRNPNFRPEDDGTTHCNQATYAVAKAV
ncbi:MAG TPA: hypothetical protein VFY40_16285, partial [Blastocatellia bacterium]|nr:hypothetical protein [Blastocatellia bacterium]